MAHVLAHPAIEDERDLSDVLVARFEEEEDDEWSGDEEGWDDEDDLDDEDEWDDDDEDWDDDDEDWEDGDGEEWSEDEDA